MYRKLLLGLAATVLATLLGEAGARCFGLRPYVAPTQVISESLPGPFLQPHPRYGYSNTPGTFSVTFNYGRRYRARHSAEGLRATRPAVLESWYQGLPRIHVHGCSFTYGWSLEDSDTFPWHVQAALPGFDVRNFGVAGYGTNQALLQVQDQLEAGITPRLTVVTYASLHAERNVLGHGFRKAIVPFDNQIRGLLYPRAEIHAEGVRSELAPLLYAPPWLARRSAVFNTFSDRLASRRSSPAQARRVTLAVLEALQAHCRANDAPLLIAGIYSDDETRAMLERCAALGLPTVDLSVDLSDPALRVSDHDWHPSAAANRVFASRLLTELRKGPWLRS